jgi:hypothetical protein
MSKMGSHDPFEHLKHKLWPKKGSGVKLAVWLPPLKVRNHPNFLVCRWNVTYHWKDLNKGYNFSLDFISIEGLHAKLWALKVTRQNDIWVLVPWLGTKYTIRGKVVTSPKFKPWWVLWVCVCLWFVRAPKCSNYALINLLFDLCRPMWVSKLLINLPSPILELQHALLPPKCCELESVPNSLLFRCFCFRLPFESIK